MTDIAIAGAGPLEAEPIAALHAATLGAAAVARGGDAASWSAAFIARLLALPGAFAALARMQAPVGFILCLPAGEAVDIAAIGVVASARRRGVGRALVAAAATHARGAGALRLMLEVAADNAAAIAFYRTAGFAEVGRRPGYYAATAAGAAGDALILSKNL